MKFRRNIGDNNGASVKFPGELFCPPIRASYFRKHMEKFSPPVPADYWMLDAPAIMAAISTKAKMSQWLVNIGANPTSKGENGEREVIQGDDCSGLWPMGYYGVNFDVPGNEAQMKKELHCRYASISVRKPGCPGASTMTER